MLVFLTYLKKLGFHSGTDGGTRETESERAIAGGSVSVAAAPAPTGATILLVLLFVGLALVVRLLFFEGLWGSDDFDHVRYATLWDRAPANHWETRLLYNALLRGSILAFGASESAYAVPGLLASMLLVGLTVAFAARTLGLNGAVIAGALIATLPLDVITSTVPISHPLATSFAALGTVLLLGPSGVLRSTVLAAGAFALAMLAHISLVTFIAALSAALFLAGQDRGDRTRALAGAALSFGLFLVLWFSLFALVTGDPLHEYKVLERRYDTDPYITTFSALWFLWPIYSFLISKDFGIVIAIAVVGVALRGPAIVSRVRVLALAIPLLWVWIGYGTQKPTSYVPFWRLARYAYPLALPACVAAAAVLRSLPRFRSLVCVSLVGMNLLILMSSGPWGQGVKVSRELLEYARSHPERWFWTDPRSARDLYILAGCRAPTNVTASTVSSLVEAPTGVALLVNTLNLERDGVLVALPRGAERPTLYTTPRRPRMIAKLLPASFLDRFPWLIRRPGALVLGARSSARAQP
jgi:hypothetical protein